MNLLYFLAVVLSLSAVWFLVRPLARTAGDANRSSEQWHQLNLLRDRLLAQLRELEQQAVDGVIDESVINDERRGLEVELAPVLREIELLRDTPEATPEETLLSKPRQRLWLLVFGVFLLPMTLGIFALNSWDTFRALYRPAASPHGQAGTAVPPQAMEMVTRLEERLQQSPQDPQGWVRLGRSYTRLGRIEEARRAFDRAYIQAPDDVEIVLAYATFLYRSNPNEIRGKVRQVHEKLLALEPDNPGALWFFGLVAYEEGKYRQAIRTWSKLKKVLPTDSPANKSVDKAIESATAKLKVPGPS